MRAKVRDASRLGVRGVFYLFIFVSGVVGTKGEVRADPWQTEPFLNSIEGSAFDFKYIHEGLESIHSVRFGEDVINQYQQFFNRMTLNKSMDDGAKRIRSIEKLSVGDLGTLLHESFHAFKANHMDVDATYRHYKSWFEARADVVFGDLPKDKRRVALEEAYASFIGLIGDTRAAFSRMIKQPSENDCELRLAYMRRLWVVDWQQEIKGYYYRDGIGEYWADQIGGLWTLVTEGSKAYGQYKNSDGAIYVSEALPELDKRWISANIFEGRISKDFDQTFTKDLKDIGCDPASKPQHLARTGTND